MVKRFWFLLLILTSYQCIGQMLDNSKGNAFTDTPFFNSEFIKSNKIKRITGHYSTKASMDVIRENDLVYVYEFSDSGHMIRKYETVNVGGTQDTIINSYEYDQKGRMIVHRKSDQYGFYSTHYKYDSLGRVIRTEYRRDLSKGRDRIHFNLDKSFIITHESSEYYESEGMLKRTYLNNYGKPFQNKFSYFDANGYLIKEEENLTVHSGRRLTYYEYNEKGLLSEMKKESSVMGKHSYKEEYTYDDYHNLLSKNVYRNGEYKTEYQIIYEPQTKLISAVITRNVSNDFITILRFDQFDFQ